MAISELKFESREPTRTELLIDALERMGFNRRTMGPAIERLGGLASFIPGVSSTMLPPDASLGDQVLAGFELVPGAAGIKGAGKYILNESKPMLHGSMNKGIKELTKLVEGMPNVLNPSMQRGGVYLTDDAADAAMYATRGKEYGQIYNVDVNPKGMVDAENLPFGIATMLKGMASSKSARIESVTPSQFQARDILNFMENPNMMYFPRNFDPQISNALLKKGVGSMIFNIKGGSGSKKPFQRMIVLDDKLMKIKKPMKVNEKDIDEAALRLSPFKFDQRMKRLRRFFEDD